MTDTNFPLIVDPRVGSIELTRHLKIPCEVSTLRYADVAFAGFGPDEQIYSIGIERKVIRDLASSILSGRLSGHQLIGLLDFYHIVYILVEGIWRVNDGILEVMEGRGWKPLRSKALPGKTFGYTEISNYLNTLAIVTGVHLWFTDNIQLSGEWIRHTYYWWQKAWNSHHSHLNFVHTQDRPKHARLIRPSLVHRMVKEIPGVGWDRGMEISKVYHTMEELMAASKKDLMKIQGIGPGIADKIYEDLHAK